MLKVNNISKKFNGLKVLDKVSFEFSKKGVLGLTGPNGSGKTTLFNIIGGNTLPDEGEISYDGMIINGYPLHKRAAFGIVRTYQDGKVFPSHTLKEHLLLIKSINRSNKTFSDIEQLLHKVGLEDKINKAASTLSFGQKKRLELTMALMREDVKLYLFDEPTAGVDPGFIQKFQEILRDLKKSDKYIIIIEHNLNLIKEVADQIIILEGGKVLAMGTPLAVLECKEVHNAYLGEVYAS